MHLIDDFYMDLIGKTTEGVQRRFRVVAQNLANMNTPGYKRREVTFEDQLREFLGTERKRMPLKITNPRHMSNIPLKLDDVKPKVRRDYYGAYRNDGNNVDPEIEMAKLAEARMEYQALMRFLSKRITMLKGVMTGAGR